MHGFAPYFSLSKMVKIRRRKCIIIFTTYSGDEIQHNINRTASQQLMM